MTVELIKRILDESEDNYTKQQMYDRLVKQYQNLAYWLAYSRLGDTHLSHDVAQEAFLIAWRDLRKLNDPEAFPGWFRQIVLSQANRLTRRKSFHTVVMEDTVESKDPEVNPEQAAERNELAQQVWHAINKLPPVEKQMIVLFYFNDLSYERISMLLDTTISNVKKRLFNARRKLGERLLLSVQDHLRPYQPSRDDKFCNMVKQLVSTGSFSRGISGQLEITLQSNGGYASTPHFYKVPLHVSLTAKTDSTNLRLRFAKSELILNWEHRQDELHWVDPATGEPKGIPGQGYIPPGKWVKIDWIVEADYTALLVNGHERHRAYGEYSHLAGQIGVGAAHRSIVTIKSLHVRGGISETGIPIVAPPRYECDGSMVHVDWEKHDHAVEWFASHMGWNIVGNGARRQADDTLDERMTALGVPRFGIIWIKSVRTDNINHHLYSKSGGEEPHLRLCFNTKDIAYAHELFRIKQIRRTELYNGPGCRQYFDFWATEENIRLTACGDERDTRDDCLFSPHDWHRIGVTDLNRAIAWYREFLGFQVVEEFRERGWVLMATRNSFYSVGLSEIWLEQLPSNARTEPCDYPVRPYFHLRKLTEEYDRLAQGGVNVSPIVGKPPIEGYSLFHFYDPDGNRLNVWCY